MRPYRWMTDVGAFCKVVGPAGNTIPMSAVRKVFEPDNAYPDYTVLVYTKASDMCNFGDVWDIRRNGKEILLLPFANVDTPKFAIKISGIKRLMILDKKFEPLWQCQMTKRFHCTRRRVF